MENENRRLHVKDGALKYTKGYKKWRWTRNIMTFFLVLLVAVVVLTTIFIYVKQPVKTEEGYLHAKPLYGLAELGDEVLVVENKSSNVFTPIVNFITPQDAYFAKVIAGPYGEIEMTNGDYRVSDGKNIISVNVENPPEFLDLEYVVRKVDESGKFEKGNKDSVITKKELLGKKIN